jgi:hypothetical protein
MKNPNAVSLGRLGGKKGGPARAKALSAERRTEIARQAVLTRWSKRPASASSIDMKRLADDRVYRRDLANKHVLGTNVDPGDLEHVLYNLTLPPLERLARGLS